MLDSRIGKVRSGTFKSLGVAPQIRLYPVIVTYDSLAARGGSRGGSPHRTVGRYVGATVREVMR